MCGDGVIVGQETCDDNNTDANDGCSATCVVECGFDCGLAEPSVCTSTGGDGVLVAPNEACDDGNTNKDDGCSSSCTIEPGYLCSDPTGCGASSCVWLTGNEFCGDGMTLGAELETSGFCDDGNTQDGDG